MIDYYCIHHSPAIERKEYLLPFFKKENIKINWIEDFLPNSNEVCKIETIYSSHAANKSFLNLAEISCYLKHFKAIESISKSNNNGLIIEDDIEIPEFNFTNFINNIENLFIENNGDLLFIGSFTGSDIDDKFNGEIINSQWTRSRCAHCYLITNKCAKNILSFMSNIIAPLDWQLNYAIDKFNLKSFWSKKHINQRTEKGKIPSLLR